MKGISGSLSLLSITDLMQWVEMSKKSGALFVSNEKKSKCFCFKEGKLLLASSKEKDGRFGDIVSKECNVSTDVIRKAIHTSRESGISFIGYLIENNIISKDFVSAALNVVAERNIIDILSWPDGSFEFVEGLPSYMSDSPIDVNASFIVFESVRKYDELMKNRGKPKN
jgi:hypothetical protein